MRRLAPVVITAGFCVAVVPTAGGNTVQFSPPEPRLQWVRSRAVEPGVLVGRVTDVETGDPINGAYVRLGAPPNVVLSDENGFFRLQPEIPAATQLELYVAFIGYYRMQDTVVWVPTMGMAVEASLRKRTPVELCDMVCGEEGCAGGVRVLVRDVLSGAAPDAEITLIVQSRQVSDTTVAAVHLAHPVYGCQPARVWESPVRLRSRLCPHLM